MKKRLNIGIVGATGAVGREALSILEEKEIPVERVELFASSASLGVDILFGTRNLIVGEVGPGCFDGLDVVLGTTSSKVARTWVPQAVKAGALVIDNSSAYRMDPEIPLIVPEVNAQAIGDWKKRGIIANPNCSTAQLVVALKPIADAVGLERVVISSYQSTSGTGQKGMEALSREVLRLYQRGSLEGSSGEVEDEDDVVVEGSTGLLDDQDFQDDGGLPPDDDFVSPYPHQIAFNGIPQIGDFLPDGYSEEETKLIKESRKILGLPELRVTATCVRVPWFACHALSVNIETSSHLSAAAARALLEQAPGVVVEDDPGRSIYPMPFPHAGSDPVYVGRIRQDESLKNGLNLWIVADNLRKGAALNAVQILQAWVERYR
jgi:aspartate-semialdehyde dehydrogenase